MIGLPHVRRSFNLGSVSLPDQKEGGGGPWCQLHSHQSACKVLHVSRRACLLNLVERGELKQEEKAIFQHAWRKGAEASKNWKPELQDTSRSVDTKLGRLDLHQVGSSQCMLGKWSTSIVGSCWFLLPTGVRCGERCCFVGNWCEGWSEGRRGAGISENWLEIELGSNQKGGNLKFDERPGL